MAKCKMIYLHSSLLFVEGDPSLALRDDTIVLLYSGGKKVAIRNCFLIFTIFFESPLFSPSVIPKSSVILSASEGSPAINRISDKKYFRYINNITFFNQLRINDL